MQTIGILGAGKLGITLAQLALKTGYSVYIASSGESSHIALTVEVLAPGAIAATSEEAIAKSDIVILALPLGNYRTLDSAAFDGKLVIDAMNHWWEVDGPREDIVPTAQSSRQAEQELLASARVVKALNHMGYHDLHDEPKPEGAPGRKAIALAGDSKSDNETVATLINNFGFDPLPIGNLANGQRLEPGGPVFGVNVDLQTLQSLLPREN
jgi:predicted dinucleotide-binding enzyme